MDTEGDSRGVTAAMEVARTGRMGAFLELGGEGLRTTLLTLSTSLARRLAGSSTSGTGKSSPDFDVLDSDCDSAMSVSEARGRAPPRVFSEPMMAQWATQTEASPKRRSPHDEAFSPSELMGLLENFATPFLPWVTQAQFPSRGSTARDERCQRHLGFHVAMQVIFAAYTEAVLGPEPPEDYRLLSAEAPPALTTPRTVLAPETLPVDGPVVPDPDDDPAASPPSRVVRETAPWRDVGDRELDTLSRPASPILGPAFNERCQDSFGASSTSPALDPEAARRAKYSPLAGLSPAHGAGPSVGLWGSGSRGQAAQPAPATPLHWPVSDGEPEEESGSPSILNYANKSNHVSTVVRAQVEPALRVELVDRPKSMAPPRRVGRLATNKFGLTVTPASLSQQERAKNMRQTTLSQCFPTRPQPKLPDSDEDPEIKRAIAISLQDVQNGSKPSGSEPRPQDPLSPRPDPGSCDQCRALYGHMKLSASTRQKLVEQCRHRRIAKRVWEQAGESPKERWRSEINPEELAMDVTQEGSPLKTRAYRKQVKADRQKKQLHF